MEDSVAGPGRAGARCCWLWWNRRPGGQGL